VQQIRAAPPDAMNLLRGVDEQKEERERPRRHRAQLERKGRHLLEESLEARGIGIASPAIAAGFPKSFDGAKRVRSLQSVDHPAKRRRKPADILVKQDVLGTCQGIGGDGRRSSGHRNDGTRLSACGLVMVTVASRCRSRAR